MPYRIGFSPLPGEGHSITLEILSELLPPHPPLGLSRLLLSSPLLAPDRSGPQPRAPDLSEMSEYMPERMSNSMAEYIYIFIYIYIFNVYFQMVCQEQWQNTYQGGDESKKVILKEVVWELGSHEPVGHYRFHRYKNPPTIMFQLYTVISPFIMLKANRDPNKFTIQAI